MAANILAGFVKGASGRMLDQMDERKKNEQEMKKAEMLERLRRETLEYTAELQDKISSKEVDDKLTSNDFSTGKRILRNAKGEKIGELDMTASEMDAYSLEREAADLGLEDARLGLDVKRANINQSNAAADTSRAYASRARSLDGGSSGKGGKKNKDGEIPDMLVAEYERAFEELEASGASPAVLANFQTEFHNGLESGWDKATQRRFLNLMRRRFTDKWKDRDGVLRRPMLDQHTSANATLDSKLSN